MSNNSYSFNNNILEYSLVLGGSNFSYVDEKGSTVNSCPPIVSGSRAKVKYSGIDEDLYLSLYGVTFRRRMYDTGYIKAELLIQTKADLGVKDISGMLLRRSVTLKAGDKEVAKNYFIRDLSPQFEGGTDNTFSYIYIRLDIVSQDSLLKFNRYSQAHLGQKFITEIVKPAADVAGVGLRGVDDSTLQWLAYLDSSNKQVEYIQPYVVQYNESFYDFMKRVANRCGEPFYFEDGQLCFGLPKNGGTTNVAGARRIIFQRVSDGPYSCDPFLGTDYARDSLKEYRTYTKDNTPYWTYEPDDKHILTDKVEKENGYPADAFKSGTFIRNSEIASEDHYMLLFKDKFARDSSTDLWLGDLEARIVGWVSLVLNSTSLLEAVGKFAEKEIDAAFKLIAKANTATAAGNQALADAAVSSSNDYAVLFSKVDDNKKHWITLDYYKNIRDKGEEQARKMVCIDMGEHYCDIRLGDKITIPNDDGSTYVVIDIEMTSGVPWKRTYDGFTGDATPEGGAQSQRIYAIPLTSDGKFFPPVLTDKPFRVSGPQPAFIVDAGDFANQGRVRIRYPWQPAPTTEQSAEKSAKEAMDKALEELKKYAFVTLEKDGTYTITKRVVIKDSDYDPIVKAFKDARSAWVQAQFALTIAEAASPWIRMSVPMATDGGGMYFQPEKGDEVMVDYENGNIDRPFVTGTLYSKNVPAPSRGKRVIVSKNGHTIKMDDPDDSTLILQGIFPLAKALASYGVKFPQLVGDPSSALGGIELTDKPGIYSIKMSSHDRQIKISSPLGDVKVDAFTGITLDAPNGDITINGKNVYISAYNKMTLTSGKNIMQGGMGGFFSCVASGKSWGFTAAKTLLNLTAVKFFDMSLIRTVIEVFIRPIDGTMKLKSYRYMMMEAGPGGAADDKAAYASRPMDKRTAKKANNARLVSDFIGVVDGKLDRFISEYVRAFNELRAASENFPSTAERNYFGIGKNIERPANKNDFLKDMFEKAPADGTAVFRTLAGYIGDENQFKFRRPALPSYLEHKMLRDMVTLMEKVIPLKKLASDFEHILDDLGAGGKYDCFRMSAQAPGILTTEPAVSGGGGGAPAAPELFSDSIRLINDFVQHPDESIFDDELHEADFAEWKKYIKRRIAHAVIEQCRGNNNPIEGCNFPAAEYGTVRTIGADLTVHTNDTTLQDGANPFSDADWANYVNAIKIREKESNDFVEGFKASAELIIMNKIMPFEWWVWKPDSQGKILFSDNKGKTVRFKNGETESYDNPDRLFDEEETHLRAALQF